MFSDKVDLISRDFAAGTEPGLFAITTRAGDVVTFGTSICFEVSVDPLVADLVRGGAQILVVQTNNATFGFTDESLQQLAISRLRAIEHGRAVAHISTVGVSALVLPDGTAVAPTQLFTQAVLSGNLPLRSELTLATRLGEWPEFAAVGLLLGLVFVGTGRNLRRRSAVRVSDPALERTP